MRAALRRLLDETWILILASGIALGYAALTFAQATGEMVARALRSESESDFSGDGGFLAFRLGSHVIELVGVVSGAVAFVIVLAAVATVVTLVRRREDELPAAD